MGRHRHRDDEEPCCDGESLKIPCVGAIPPFRLHYMLVMMIVFSACFCYMGPGNWANGGSATAARGKKEVQLSPVNHPNVLYLAMTIFGFLITATILHESGHAAATLCAPKGRVRHIMLNPCCGGHAFVSHSGGPLWEAWVAFAGPIWDLSIAILVYFIQSMATGHVYSMYLHEYSNAFDQLELQKLAKEGNEIRKIGRSGTVGFKKHFLDDSGVYWRIALTILLDWEVMAFCFNMLPIVTLDGSDFFGSLVRLCSSPQVSAAFVIVASSTCIFGIAWWRVISPGWDIYNKWDSIPDDPKWKNSEVWTFSLISVFVLLKLGQLMTPLISLVVDATKNRLYKYHVFQDREGRKEALLDKRLRHRARRRVIPV
jgi:hypothetical protein